MPYLNADSSLAGDLKNAGFACFGSIAELEHDVASIGEEATAALVMNRYNGLKLLRETLGDEAIDYREVGGYEMCFEPPKQERIDFLTTCLRHILGHVHTPFSRPKVMGFHRSHSFDQKRSRGYRGYWKNDGRLAAESGTNRVLPFTQSTVEKIESTEGKTVYIEKRMVLWCFLPIKLPLYECLQSKVSRRRRT